MKIQLATDTIIETFNPTEPGKMAAKAVKVPGAGQSAEIQLTVTCRECTFELRSIAYIKMKDFRPYIETYLTR